MYCKLENHTQRHHVLHAQVKLFLTQDPLHAFIIFSNRPKHTARRAFTPTEMLTMDRMDCEASMLTDP